LNDRTRQLEELKKISPFYRFLRKILNVFLPLLPVLVAAGFIQGVTNIADVLPEGKIFIDTWWYQVLKTIGWMAYTYLPVFVCMNTAKEFKGNRILGGITGLLFVSNSSMPLLSMVNRLPVILPFNEDEEIIRELVSCVDGLILSGGHDVAPFNYGEEPEQKLGEIFPERDKFDYMLLSEAKKKKIPYYFSTVLLCHCWH